MISSEQLQIFGKAFTPEQAWDVFLRALDQFAAEPTTPHREHVCDSAKIFAASSCWLTLETVRKITEGEEQDEQSSTS